LNQSLRKNEFVAAGRRQVQSLFRQIARYDDPTLLTAAVQGVQHTAAEDADILMTNDLVLFSGAQE
jgi:hypothetical protein